MNNHLMVAACDVGRGVFAARPLPAGTVLLHFAGKSYDRRDPLHASPGGANLFQTDSTSYILPEPPGLYVNHSCEPNAGIRNGVELIALREIRAGEEIRFDYSTTMDEDYWTMECCCATRPCRGIVRDFKTLPEDIRQEYLAQNIVPRFIAGQYELATQTQS